MPRVQGVVLIDLDDLDGAQRQFQQALLTAPHNQHTEASRNLMLLANRQASHTHRPVDEDEL